MRRRPPIFLWIHALILAPTPWCAVAVGQLQHTAADQEYRETIEPMLVDHCYGCHGDGGREGNLALDQFPTAESLLAAKSLWWSVLKNVRADIMPPAGEQRPSAHQKEILAKWIREGVFELDPQNPDPGRMTLRRLNRIEYQNTIRDLMNVEFNTDVEFPPDDTGHGFDNIGDVLSISPLLMEKYLKAAEEIVDRAVPKETTVIPSISLDGKDFRDSSQKDEQDDRRVGRLSFYTAQQVSSSLRVPHAGDYRISLQTGVSGGFDFEPGRCTVQFSLDDIELLESEYSWQSGQQATYDYTFEANLAAGDHEIAFSLQPLTPDVDTTSSLSLRIGSVRVEGPLDRDYWTNPPGYDRFFPRDAPPGDAAARREYARDILQEFATRAFRRPVDAAQLERLVEIAEVAQQNGRSFEEGIGRAITAVLVSPRFLFKVEQPVAGSADRFPLVDEFSLASRLSYFLWATMPDAELIGLASRGELRANLDQQIQRLMKDSRSSALIENFVGQWLQARDVEAVTIDPQAASGLEFEYNQLRKQFDTADGRRFEPGSDDPPERIAKYERFRKIREEYQALRNSLDGGLRRDMRRETEMLFEHIMREDRSVLDLLDANYTFLSERLAKHYGIEGVSGNDMQRIELRPEDHRGGVLTQATFLMVTSNPSRTSPVKRGLFVLENILGTPTPPPPADVPDLEAAKEKESGDSQTLRELLEAHRSDVQCSSCHQRFDPLGLALENYTAMGTWRGQENKRPIDASGRLITGESFADLRQLKSILTGPRRFDFYNCLTERFLTFALGRGLEYYDEQVLGDIVAQLNESDGRFSVLLYGVINSAPFQRQRAVSDEGARLSNIP